MWAASTGLRGFDHVRKLEGDSLSITCLSINLTIAAGELCMIADSSKSRVKMLYLLEIGGVCLLQVPSEK